MRHPPLDAGHNMPVPPLRTVQKSWPPDPPKNMFTYKKKRPRLKVDVTKRWNGFHLEILNPSKNGVFRSPTYQVKSFWKMWHPVKNTSTIAFNLDLVVGVSQPHELKIISPFGSISAIRLPCNLTDVNPSESTLTEVLDFDQSVRVAIAACI